MGNCDLVFDISSAPPSATDAGMEFYEDYTIQHNNITFRGTCEGTPLPTVLIEMWDNEESQRVSAGIVTFEEPVYLEIGGLDDIRFTVEDFIFSGTSEQQAYIEGGGREDWWMMKESGDVNVYYTTILDSYVSGGANWNSYLTRGNIDGGNNIGWIWMPSSTVITNIGTDVSHYGFIAHGEITDTGGENANLRGFCYIQGTDGIPTSADNINYEEGDFGLEEYSLPITDLAARGIYLFRAYAINSFGIFYGDVLPIGIGSEYCFYDVQANHTIHVEYDIISTDHTITATAIASGGTGTIDPSGNVVVSFDGTANFSFSADPSSLLTPFDIENYRAAILIDEEEIDLPYGSSYTFSNVVEDHSIDIIYANYDNNHSWLIDSCLLDELPTPSGGHTISGLDNDGTNIYILDRTWGSTSHRLWIFTLDGEYITDYPVTRDLVTANINNNGVVVDDNYAYIGEMDEINIYEKLTGIYTTTIPITGLSHTYFITNMCMSPDKQYIYISAIHGKILKFKISDKSEIWSVDHYEYPRSEGKLSIAQYGIQADENYIFILDSYDTKVVRYNTSDGSYTTGYESVSFSTNGSAMNLTMQRNYLFTTRNYDTFPYVFDKNASGVSAEDPEHNFWASYAIESDESESYLTAAYANTSITSTNQYLYILYNLTTKGPIWLRKIFTHTTHSFTVESLCDYTTLGGTGSISPSGYYLVDNNDTYTLDVTVDASNMAWVYLDDINTGWTAYNETKTYTLSNVTANHHITVRFGGV